MQTKKVLLNQPVLNKLVYGTVAQNKYSSSHENKRYANYGTSSFVITDN